MPCESIDSPSLFSNVTMMLPYVKLSIYTQYIIMTKQNRIVTPLYKKVHCIHFHTLNSVHR